MLKSLTNFSATLVDRKSKFQSCCCSISNQSEIPAILEKLLNDDKHVAKASHPHMYAWRTGTLSKQIGATKKAKGKPNKKDSNKIDMTNNTKEWSNIEQGCFDGGESGAGQRLLTLLERSNICNVLVVVTRWYGGTPLGSSRFRHISTVAVESLKIGNFLN